ncbi:hypothetical protein [Aquimarina sediminis]|uniref:hypothetical protein n=1 Tax=Aquimarina sediminis TaxID=2070536 RepID=UPI000CA085F8|nr:hypothetical protein [Aquimarina sediminis]
MKARLFLFFLLCIEVTIYAQIENNSSLRIDRESNLSTNKFSLSKELSTPDYNSSLYALPKELSEYSRRNQTFDMTGNTGFLKPNTELTPKWFKKDKNVSEEFKSDQYLGDFKSGGKFVHLIYRDHESVDGDVVRIYINDDIIGPRIYLTSSFQGIKINLVKGFNKIDIEALNQGESGPNTAEFHLYDDQGNIITGNEWNLTTGVKATLIVVKD